MRFLHRVTTRKGFVDLHNHTNRSYSYKEIEHIYLTPCSYLYEVKEYVDGKVYMIIDEVDYNQDESIGWRDAYDVNVVHYYEYDVDSGNLTELETATEFE